MKFKPDYDILILYRAFSGKGNKKMGKSLKGKELGVGISQRKDEIYQARYTDRWGKRQTIYDSNLRELKKKLAVAVAENEKLTNVREQITLDEWFERWMKIYKEKSIRPNTKREYVHLYHKNISPYCGGKLLNKFVKSDIQNLIDIADDDNYGYERQSKIKIILKDMFQRAVEDHLVVNNPVSGIKLRKDKEINARALTIEEQTTFFEYSQNTFYDNLFNVAVNTGLRPGELFALQFDDINLEEGYIDVNKTLVYQKYLTDTRKEFHVEAPKTKQSYRRVPINRICKIYLEKQMELKEIVSEKRPKEQNDYLFVTKFNTPLNSQIYADAIRAVIRSINLTRAKDNQFLNFSGHVFRHTFATRCFEAGVEAKVVQKYLGHASLKMTMDLYTHVTDDKSSEDIEKICVSNPVNIFLRKTKIS